MAQDTHSIPLSVKTLNVSNFRKKVKSLLLNVLGNEDNYLNVNFLIEYQGFHLRPEAGRFVRSFAIPRPVL